MTPSTTDLTDFDIDANRNQEGCRAELPHKPCWDRVKLMDWIDEDGAKTLLINFFGGGYFLLFTF